MNPEAYVQMAQTEAQHWWFRGRRAILTSVLQGLKLPTAANILEVGCGTGGNLEMLATFGSVQAMELDEHARSLARRKTQNRFSIEAGACPDQIPFGAQQFDLICMFDVLEHIDADSQTLNALRVRLKNNGKIVLTVPAYPWLWSTHDTFLHHKRRYTRGELIEKTKAAGFEVERVSFFNSALFPAIALARLKDRIVGAAQAAGTSLPPAPVNGLLTGLFGAERHALKAFNLPFGVSLLCVLGRGQVLAA